MILLALGCLACRVELKSPFLFLSCRLRVDCMRKTVDVHIVSVLIVHLPVFFTNFDPLLRVHRMMAVGGRATMALSATRMQKSQRAATPLDIKMEEPLLLRAASTKLAGLVFAHTPVPNIRFNLGACWQISNGFTSG